MADTRLSRYDVSLEYDVTFETRRIARDVPAIQFPGDWKVKILPPFSGASVRFYVEKDELSVSVYLDCFQMLGVYNEEPYWEVYPTRTSEGDWDIARCSMEDVEQLLSIITQALKNQEKYR